MRGRWTGAALLVALLAVAALFVTAGGAQPGDGDGTGGQVATGDRAERSDRAAPDDREPGAERDAQERGAPASPGSAPGSFAPSTDPAPGGAGDAAAVHPGDQEQTTLLAAAEQPVGRGVERPAAGITGEGDARAPVDPDDVLSATAARGGCAVGYGDGGQCLPARPPSSAGTSTWTCEDVRLLFPGGLAASTQDPLGLDTDGDGRACGPGD